MTNRSKKALVLTIDGWGTNLVGSYGNPLCQTVHLDRLAASSIVFDRCYVNSSNPFEVLESIASGLHPVEQSFHKTDLALRSKTLAKILTLKNRQSVFITDDKEASELDWVQDFNEVVFFEPKSEEENSGSASDPEVESQADRNEGETDLDASKLEIELDQTLEQSDVDTDFLSEASDDDEEEAEDEMEGDWEWEEVHESLAFEPEDTSELWKDSRLAKFTEAALGELAQFGETFDAMPDLTWIHLTGLKACWDAPYIYRLALCDEDDPRPSTSWTPAAFATDRDTDPDHVFDAVCGASAQGRVVDHVWSWIELFLNQLAHPEDLMIVIMGTRGYPLGEHDAVGLSSKSLFNETIHVPLIIKPGSIAIGSRCRRIVQPMSVYSTLIDWLVGPEALKVDRDYAPALIELLKVSESETELVALEDQPAMSIAVGSNTVALHTPVWSAIWKADAVSEGESIVMEQAFDRDSNQENRSDSKDRPALFLAPDDRWQQNDVAVRVPEIVEQVVATKQAIIEWLYAHGSDGTPEIPESLLSPVS